MAAMPLILASRSPRRTDLLRNAGFVFEIVPADVDETRYPADATPAEIASHLACIKAEAIAALHPHAVVLGADTVVAVGQTLYGKAETPHEARDMLAALAGQRQAVITGVAIIAPGKAAQVRAVTSIVEMRPMTPSELDAYIASDEWRGKAGAYGIQDQDADNDPFVKIVEGDYTNVVGLPIDVVRSMLADHDVHPCVRS